MSFLYLHTLNGRFCFSMLMSNGRFCFSMLMSVLTGRLWYLKEERISLSSILL